MAGTVKTAETPSTEPDPAVSSPPPTECLDAPPHLVEPPAVAKPKLSAAQIASLTDTLSSLMVAREQLRPPPSEEELVAWADAAARVTVELGLAPRGDCTQAMWRQLLTDVRIFIESGWLSRASALGWGGLEIFGAHRDAPWERFDCMGLTLLLSGGQVVALDGKGAVIKQASGVVHTYRRVQVDLNAVSIDEIE